MTHFAAYGQYVENYFKCGHNMLYFQQKNQRYPLYILHFPYRHFKLENKHSVIDIKLLYRYQHSTLSKDTLCKI